MEACISLLLVVLVSTSLALWYTQLSQEQAFVRKRVRSLLALCTAIEYMRARGSIYSYKDERYSIRWRIEPETELRSYKKVAVSIVENGVEKITIHTGALLS